MVSVGTIDRAVTAGRPIRVWHGRAVSLVATRTAAEVRVETVPMRRQAIEGIPGVRLPAMIRLLAGVGRTGGEQWATSSLAAEGAEGGRDQLR